MTLKTPFFSTCIFLCVTFSANRIYAEDYFSNALRIFSEGNFHEASIEFERAIFYENDNNRVVEFRYYKSLCFKNLGEYQKALNELNTINLFTAPDSLFLLIRYEQALCNYLNRDVNQALWNLNDIKIRIKDTLKTIDILPLNILCLNANRNWVEAREQWNFYLDHSGIQDSVIDVYREKIRALYKDHSIPRYYSPKKAGVLSTFIPGSGQMYCGSVGEGSLNFLINMSLLGYAAWEIYTKYYFTGWFVGVGLFTKFYFGGIQRAGHLATAKNNEVIKKFNGRMTSMMVELLDQKHRNQSGGAKGINNLPVRK
jgi:tetratricopeptide (TPR) repeat protein